MMCTFEEAFGADYGPDRPNSQWDKPFFNNRDLEPKNRFVSWIDLMGAANNMILSLPNASCFIGKIHCAGLQARSRFSSVSLHPITDGFYAVGERWQDICDFTARVMRSLAYCFEHEAENRYRFLVRAGIAYGRFIDGAQMAAGSDTFKGEDKYTNNVLVGCPLAWAYKAEGKAPPFGIYIDQSVRTHSGERIAWVLHQWWKDPQACWAKHFGGEVKAHLEWLEYNAIGCRYPTDKHAGYLKAVTEYFKL